MDRSCGTKKVEIVYNSQTFIYSANKSHISWDGPFRWDLATRFQQNRSYGNQLLNLVLTVIADNCNLGINNAFSHFSVANRDNQRSEQIYQFNGIKLFEWDLKWVSWDMNQAPCNPDPIETLQIPQVYGTFLGIQKRYSIGPSGTTRPIKYYSPQGMVKHKSHGIISQL